LFIHGSSTSSTFALLYSVVLYAIVFVYITIMIYHTQAYVTSRSHPIKNIRASYTLIGCIKSLFYIQYIIIIIINIIIISTVHLNARALVKCRRHSHHDHIIVNSKVITRIVCRVLEVFSGQSCRYS